MSSFDIFNFNSPPENKIDKKVNIKSISTGEPRQCKFCDKIFECDSTQAKGRQNQISNIRHHSLNHFKEKLQVLLPDKKPWQCPICDHVGRDLISLTRHYALVHDQIAEYCNKDDLNGIAVEKEKDLASAYNYENKTEEFGIKYFLDKTENTIRDDESDSNNNYDDTLDGRRRKQKGSSSKEFKTEEERLFDIALANAVAKISFWYENGNIDGGNINIDPGKSNQQNKSGSISVPKTKKSNPVNEDTEDENAKGVKDTRPNKPLKEETHDDSVLENLRVNEKYSQQKSNDDIEEIENIDGDEEQNNSLNNSISEKLAPPKKTFSMDPFSQPKISTVRKSILSMDPFNAPPSPPPQPIKKSKAYVDPFNDATPEKNEQSDEKSTLSENRISENRFIPVRDPEGNYMCPKCEFSSKLRVKIVKHSCS